ncbi:hypothetical protein DCO58_04140 [Helicobacter saguini]|uniref:Ankyrin repeat domain-containing protein n=2 Tax=Helicobacter saguini TaxID=1548018 RepID=A0A347W728_9HELI|nr:ankyrin repeat domain-containing protein [Helicobacter saguini]MWV62453.1 hypothetical protein [Helicobacter saguini]MWV66874.1 hypothetical protein [Helicobacter saguini]MWV69223.1 hypothetical protein [Helicobacter saguini]MWV71222.1 hypothetical protein [Helicobacter saguini]TLD93343.1 ankyrin repeat domain-containing protein [Helicobacter saguini]
MIFSLITGIARANQYDYLLYSYVLSDVESGINLQADVNSRLHNITPLFEAVKNNRLEIAYILIMNRADVNAKNNGETALHKAAQNGNPQMVQLLIAAGADAKAKDDTYGNTPLHYAAASGDNISKNVLINAGADVNEPNMYGISPAQILVAEIAVPPLIIEDLNLAVSASAFKVSNSGVIFNVRNLTNYPLQIISTDLFINGMLVASNQNPLTIPPSTSITNVNAMPIPPSGALAIKPDKNGIANVKAGFNIRYYAEGRVQNVFNSANLRLRLWNLPPAQNGQNNPQKEPRDSNNQTNTDSNNAAPASETNNTQPAQEQNNQGQ